MEIINDSNKLLTESTSLCENLSPCLFRRGDFMGNRLYFGDNLDVLRQHVKDETVDLVYLDPPFNSNSNYNVLYDSPVGQGVAAQLKAFKDTWNWEEDAAHLAIEGVRQSNLQLFRILQSLQISLGESDMMAYLAMMSIRLLELRRVLKPTGSLYLHCDPTASHYLKMVLDAVFERGFVNEIIWKRTTTKNDFYQGAKNWPRVHDTILYYARDPDKLATFMQPFTAHDPEYVRSKYPHQDENGRRFGLWDLTAPGAGSRGHPQYEFMGITRYWRYNHEKMEHLRVEGRVIQPSPGAVPRYKRYLDEMKGVAVGDVWVDIDTVNSQAHERLGYQTQKPRALLERIIATSSKPGDTILDPFCGCGTTIHAVETIGGREWIGIDIAYPAILVIEDRLKTFLPSAKYVLDGIPSGEVEARALARIEPHTFQQWAVGRLGGQPRGRGADRGIDGEIIYLTGVRKYGRAIVSVKGGQNCQPAWVRELAGVVKRENADIGIFVCLNPPTKEMKLEAQRSGFVDLPGGTRTKIQIVSVADLIAGPNLGILTGLNSIQLAQETREGKKRRLKNISPQELRRSPPLPPMAIKGDKPQYAQRDLALEEPLLSSPQPSRPKRRRA